MSPRTTPRRRPARRLPATLAGATAGALVVGLAAIPAHAETGTGGPIGTVARTVGDAHFEPGPCPRTADPIPDLARARCGTLTVPEKHRAKGPKGPKEPKEPRGHGGHGGRKITLAVAIMPAESSRPSPDPIVWLAGGPGDDAVSEIPMALAGDLNRDRDVIFMSQRGTYSADPVLTCPGIDRFNARALGLVSNAPSTGRLHVEATRACRDRVDGTGADRSAYNDIESSADYDALRKTLGIRKWNVFGISYGTHLALNYMRLHPKGIRSVGIDGVLPPSRAGGAVTWKAAREGFDGLFKACAEQPACNTRYPNLKATFLRLVSELEAKPLTVTVTVPVHPEPVKVVLDGSQLVTWLTFASHLAEGVPRSIDELAHGNGQRIAEQLAGGKYSPQAIGRVSHGLVYGVFCSQWTPYESRADIVRGGRRAFPSFPESMLPNAPQLAWLHDDCRAWDVPPAPPWIRDVTRSDIPTLALSGGFDAQTAPSNGAYVARTLSRSHAVTVPYVAHVVFADSPCAQTITTSFFADPARPDTRCLAGLQPPQFEIAP